MMKIKFNKINNNNSPWKFLIIYLRTYFQRIKTNPTRLKSVLKIKAIPFESSLDFETTTYLPRIKKFELISLDKKFELLIFESNKRKN